ncbi:MAG: DUF1257 domain-containing protein [Leptospiraceae bacterium]|nr:DUF1257 domain-containing protein [Leptospiraceae bacterium]
MSHFTRVVVKLKEKEVIKEALKELGYEIKEGNQEIIDYYKTKKKVEWLIVGNGSKIGINFSGEEIEVIADWWGNKVKEDEFMNSLKQKYSIRQVKKTVDEKMHNYRPILESSGDNGEYRIVLKQIRD